MLPLVLLSLIETGQVAALRFPPILFTTTIPPIFSQQQDDSLMNYVKNQDVNTFCKSSDSNGADLEDNDFVPIVPGIIRMLDENLNNLLMDPDFQALSLLDVSNIAKEFLAKFDTWCVELVHVPFPPDQYEGSSVNWDFSHGGVMKMLRSIGINPQVDRLIAMMNIFKDFMLSFGPLLDTMKPGLEKRLKMMNFTELQNLPIPDDDDELSSSLCENQIVPFIQIFQKLLIPLLDDMTDAFRGNENLLSIGKMVQFYYRLFKEFLFHEKICKMAYNNAMPMVVDVDGRMQRNMASDSTELTYITNTSCFVGEFVKTLPPSDEEEPLIDDMKRMIKMAVIMVKLAPKMVITMKSIIEIMGGIPNPNPYEEKSEIGYLMANISNVVLFAPDEVIESFSSQIATDLSLSIEMLDNDSCAETPSGLMGKELGKSAHGKFHDAA
ncbi:unnamed protein product [Oikopleura dioica]|uniref:Uncharacterized protein n=1 Tax=Oikopleura dioica TaxID=34765 RepID=E4XLV0_OIKDI|nr:unnamed protein product [Oikopleura dioica]